MKGLDSYDKMRKFVFLGKVGCGILLLFFAMFLLEDRSPRWRRIRAQASTILNEARQLDAAKDDVIQAKGLTGTNVVAFADLTPYLKPGSKLASNGGSDSLGNAFLIGDAASQLRVSPATKSALSMATGGDRFWGPYS